MNKILLIRRAAIFSPNSVDKDRAILDAVGIRLRDKGMEVTTVTEDNLTDDMQADTYLSMARSRRALDILRHHENDGLTVINSAAGIDYCTRREYIPVRDRIRTVVDGRGYWLKRIDSVAIQKDDVCYAEGVAGVSDRLAAFRHRGINDVMITEHVTGDVVKFYGVSGTSFFRIFYPTDDGLTKFDDENINGEAHHYGFSINELHDEAERIARMSGVKIYGGDCIVRSNGSFVIVDFNDWPSFSRCRDEAAEAVAGLIGKE